MVSRGASHGRAAVWLYLFAAIVSLVGLPSYCRGQVQLPTVNLGLTNFEDGFATQGWFLQEFPDYYEANQLRDASGNRVPGAGHLTAFSTTTHIVYVSDRQLLGGWAAFELLQPYADLDVRLPNGASSRVHGPGDTTLGGGVQWAPIHLGPGVLAQRFIVDVGAPTGNYSDERAANIGNHFVVLDPYYCVTYEVTRLEFSARFHYLWNSVNHDPFVGLGATSVQAGQAVHINYSMSYEVIHNLRLGFNGYWLQQVTDHKLDGRSIPYSLERTIGLGGGMQYFFGNNTWLHLNAYQETDVRNRAEGFAVTLRVSLAIPRSH